MGEEVEIKGVNKFDAYLKLIEEWFENPIEQIYDNFK